MIRCYLIFFSRSSIFFFFNDTATTEIYTLSLHDALPICYSHLMGRSPIGERREGEAGDRVHDAHKEHRDRKSTRLNSSHGYISYAVFCLKKKRKFVKEWFRYESNFVHGRDSLVDVLTERG